MYLVAGKTTDSDHPMLGKMPVLADAVTMTGEAVALYILNVGFGVAEDVRFLKRLHVLASGPVTRFTAGNTAAQFKRS
jgi:hypothetical protein